MGIHREGGLTFARIERKTPVLRPVLQSKQSSLCGLHRSGDQGKGGSNGQIVSVKKQLTEEGRESKVQGQEQILAEHLDGLERNDFCDFEKLRKRACQKRKIESNEQSKEAGQPK